MTFGPPLDADESRARLAARTSCKYPRFRPLTAAVPADIVLAVELPRTCWAALEQPFGRPLASTDITRLVSLVLLLVDLAEHSGGKVYEEILYDDEVYTAAAGHPECETVRHSAVQRYRFFAVFKHHQLASACSVLTNRFASVAEGGGNRRHAPPAPGPFCCSPFRFMTEESLKGALLQYSGRMSSVVPGRSAPATYDVPLPPNAMLAAEDRGEQHVNVPTFGSDNEDYDDERNIAADDGRGYAGIELPPPHILYPLQVTVQAASELLRRTYSKARLPQWARDPSKYFKGNKFDPPAAAMDHIRQIVGGYELMLES